MNFKRIDITVRGNDELFELELQTVRFSSLDLKEIDEDTQELKGKIAFEEDGSWLTDDEDNIITELKIERATVTFTNQNNVDLTVPIDGEIKIVDGKILILLND